nr:hypothetical protein BgiMline_004216 [Biomphalaria glabrata]
MIGSDVQYNLAILYYICLSVQHQQYSTETPQYKTMDTTLFFTIRTVLSSTPNRSIERTVTSTKFESRQGKIGHESIMKRNVKRKNNTLDRTKL